MSATIVSSIPPERRLQAGAEDRVDDQVHSRDLRKVQLPALPVDDLHDREAEATENLQVRPRIAADLGNDAEHEHRDVDAALVSVRATTKPSPPLFPRPHNTATWRSARSSKLASIAATTWRPAFSIRTMAGMPISSMVRRSASRIWLLFSTRIRRESSTRSAMLTGRRERFAHPI